MDAGSSHIASLCLSTIDATEPTARRVFAALAIAELPARANPDAVDGGDFRGRMGAIEVRVGRRDPDDALAAEYPVRVAIEDRSPAPATCGQLADMAAFELLRAAFGVIELLPSDQAGVVRWREFVVDRRGRLQSLVFDGPLPG